MKFRILFAIPLILALRACSYGHGVDRILSFDDDVEDFSCISAALNDLGFKIIEEKQYGISYSGDGLIRSASFWYTQTQKDADGNLQKNKITHSIGFGSAPASCSDVEPAGEAITQIEVKVLAACNLEPIDTQEVIRCVK